MTTINVIPRLRSLAGASLLATLALGAAAGPVTVDSAIPIYKPVSGVSGNLNSIGSDTLNNLMTF